MIISTMVMIVIPYSTNSNENLKLTQESLSMAESVRYITDLATDTRMPTRIVINLRNNSYFLEIASESNNQIFRPIAFSGSTGIQYLGQNIRIIDIKGFNTDGKGHYLIFDPAAPWPNGSISLATDDLVKTIKIRNKQIGIEDSTI